jgi:beta-phosphoglucomutase-like phosphatase (HAD superfamily)
MFACNVSIQIGPQFILPCAGLVVEDAISGLKSGKATGAKTLAVCTSTERTVLQEKGEPDYIVTDLTK